MSQRHTEQVKRADDPMVAVRSSHGHKWLSRLRSSRTFDTQRPVGDDSTKTSDSVVPGGRRHHAGQALAEFAIVVPVLALLIGGIIQFGTIFWSQQTLTQVVRDTGRWAATQTSCDDVNAVAATANAIAGNSTLFGYGSVWSATASDTSSSNEVIVSWDSPTGTCPPEDNQDVIFVSVQIDHQIPLFFPFVPGDGKLSSSAEFRMEPLPS